MESLNAIGIQCWSIFELGLGIVVWKESGRVRSREGFSGVWNARVRA